MKALIKECLLVVVLVILGACKKSYRILEPGVYYEANGIDFKVTIIEENDSLFASYFRGKYFIHEKKSRSYLRISDKKYKIWMRGDTLKFFKHSLVPIEKTKQYKFNGTWYNEEKNITIQSDLIRESFWKISLQGVEASYLPKLTADGYEITLNNKIVEFISQGDCLKDSNGYLYCKI